MVKRDLADAPHIFELLDRSLRLLRTDMLDRFGGSDLAWLRTSQHRVLSLVPRDGIRVGDLAAAAGMTAQSMGEFARGLEGRGLLLTVRDPADRRVRLLSLTDAGHDAARRGDAAVRAMEDSWRRRLGPRRWEAMRAVLGDLVATGESGRDTAALAAEEVHPGR